MHLKFKEPAQAHRTN